VAVGAGNLGRRVVIVWFLVVDDSSTRRRIPGALWKKIDRFLSG